MTPSRRQPAEAATTRLSRLLDMVPWLLAHQGVPLEEAAAEFGVSTDQRVADARHAAEPADDGLGEVGRGE